MLDPVPLQQTISETQVPLVGRLTRTWMNWLSSVYEVLFLVRLYGAEVLAVPVNGFSYPIGDNVGVLILNPAGALATGTITLPENPTNRQRIEISSTQQIVALTVSAAATVLAPPTTLSAGAGISFIYRSQTNTWYRLY